MSIERLGVVGAGAMGLGIAETAAAAGMPVELVKVTPGDLGLVEAKLRVLAVRRAEKGKLDPNDVDEVVARVTVTRDLGRLAEADLVTESVTEDVATKREVLARVEPELSEGAIVATNTSTLPLESISASMRRPTQLIGLHFFNPVAALRLVEVATTPDTAPGVIMAALHFVERLGKTPIHVQAIPGYVVNRLLVPILLHAIETLEEGTASAQAIDDAMRLGCKHPMGPLALADLIGLDVVSMMARTLHAELRDARYRAPSLLRRLVLAGHLGRKSELGIYDYRSSPLVVNPAIDAGELPFVRASGAAG